MLVALWAPRASLSAFPPAVDSQTISDLTNDLPPNDASYPDACFTLRLLAIRPLSKGQDAGDVFVQLRRHDGTWAAKLHTAATDYNQRSTNAVVVDRLTWDGSILSGTIHITIGSDSPRPRAVGFPSPADEFAVVFTAHRKPGENLPWQPDPLAFMPPWRKDIPRYGGESLTGEYKATRAGIETNGIAAGAVQPLETDTHFGTQGNAVIGRADGGGMTVLARLAPHRVASPEQAFASRRFAPDQDWSSWDGLRITVSADQRRDDAAVAIVLHGSNGASGQVTNAAFIRAGESSYTIPLADFEIDRQHVTGLAIGVANPHGVGDVAFVVRKLQLVRWPHPPAATPPLAARLVVDPNTAVQFNNATQVPKGLFGYHDVGESSPRAPAAGEPTPDEYLRLLKPGLLRPLTHVGFSASPLSTEQAQQRLADRPPVADGVFSKLALAADALDNVIWTHTTDLWARPGWMDSGVEKTAEGVRAFYRKLATDAFKPGDDHNPLRACEVWNEPFMWARHINMGKLNPVGKKAWTDPTQYGYIPAQLAADAWSTFFLAAADGAKSVNPNLRLGGPSAIEFGADDFGMFESYLQPILERCHDQLDFLTEHHYGGDPRTYAAGYEVITAWCDVKYKRRIPIYVTEANNLGANSAGRASYNVEDILTCIRLCPDKVLGRALHALWDGYLKDEGELHAYTLLSTLRGKILSADSSDPDVTVVAVAPGNGQVVVVAHSRAWEPKSLELAGLKDFTRVECLALIGSSTGPAPDLKDTEGQPTAPPPPGKTSLSRLAPSALSQLKLPPRSAIRWTFSKTDYQPAATRQIQQHFTNILLASIKPNSPVTGTVIWHDALPSGIHAARLRIVTRGIQPDQAVVLINGHASPLPPSSSNEGRVIVQEVPFDPAFLKPETTIEFRCVDIEQTNGFRVYTASVCLEMPPR